MEHGESGLPIATVINFLLLAVGLFLASQKSVRDAIFSRHEGIKKAVDEAEALRASVAKMVEEYRGKLAHLDHEIAQIFAQARADGDREQTKILARAEEAAERIREDAALRAEKELERARKELEREVVEDAAQAAAEILRRRVTEEDHKRFTNEFVAKLEEHGGR